MTSWCIRNRHVVANLLIGALLLTAATATPAPGCVDHEDESGASVHNCSGKDFSLLQLELSDKAQVLDYSWNQFVVVPVIHESADCDDTCSFFNSSSHCRKTISFSRNHISNLSADALSELRCLATLDLSFNEIKGDTLNPTTFSQGMFHLQRLLLSHNPLGYLPQMVITHPFMPTILEIDLSHCDLESMSPNSVDDLAFLTDLDLSFNKLTTINADTFKGLGSLERLDLRGNQIVTFPEHIFYDLAKLSVLLLSGNRIQGFHENAFYNDSNLQTLDVRDNHLTRVPYAALAKVTKLQTLDISHNPLTRVNEGSLLTSVRTLVMDNMPELRELGPYALASFPGLVSVSISGNKALETIDRKFLGDQRSSLKDVHLQNNKLSTLDKSALPWKQLVALRLDGNVWMCDDSLEWMIRAQSLQGGITCAWPLMLKGRNIKSLNPEDLMRDYSLQSATAIIILCVCLPLFAVCGVLIWRRRRFCPCVKVTVKGQYVTLFTRELDEEGETRMAVTLKGKAGRIHSVSNGRADDSMPFIRVHDRSIKEEIEAEDV